MAEITSAVVLDSGSGFIKAGLAHHDFPTVCAPNLMLQSEETRGSDATQRLFGKEAQKKLSELAHSGKDQIPTQNLIRPTVRGFVKDWDPQELIWYDLYQNSLKLDPQNYPVLISYAPDEHKVSKETMVQILFESLGVPGVYSSICKSLTTFLISRVAIFPIWSW